MAQAAGQGPKPPWERSSLWVYYNLNFGGELLGISGPRPTGFGLALDSPAWSRCHCSLEFEFNSNPQFFGKKRTSGDNDLKTLQLSVVYWGETDTPDTRRVTMYLVAGGGWMRSTIKDFATVGWKDTNNMFFVNAGGGVGYYFHARIGLRGDVRYQLPYGSKPGDAGWDLTGDGALAWTYVRASIGVATMF